MNWLVVTLFLLGLVLVVLGSDFLVDGASDIAKRSGISEFVIGLTIVGLGTSAPEMVVSWVGAIEGISDISFGNVIGSNIFNTIFILGLTAMILPVAVTKDNLCRDIPANILVTLVFIVLLMDKQIFGAPHGILTRFEGVFMLALFGLYMYLSFRKGSKNSHESNTRNAASATNQKERKLATSIIMLVGGIAALVFGGKLFVDNAVLIARHYGWSEKVIAITILAGGTSLPELATCVVAAAKKKGQLALGNIIGSNISNILLILGGAAIIRPLEVQSINYFDIAVLLLSSLLLLLPAIPGRKKQIGLLDGAVMLAVNFAYFYILISNI